MPAKKKPNTPAKANSAEQSPAKKTRKKRAVKSDTKKEEFFDKLANKPNSNAANSEVNQVVHDLLEKQPEDKEEVK